MDASPTTHVALLDGFALHRDGSGPDTALGELPHGVQRVVARLGMVGRLARTAAAGQLWPDVPEEHALGSLRSALWRLHKVAPGLVVASGGVLSLAAGVRVDVRELTEWAQGVLGRQAPVDGVAAVPDVGLRGELLPGWYDDWVLLERERLRQLRIHALEALADRLITAGRFGEASQAAYAAAQAEPLRESAHRAVVRVHLAEGNVVEAVRAYDSFRVLLAAELGVAPTPQMDQLVGALRRVRTPAV
ncbi:MULTISPECIES: AfsR/SARP family transcriptional regulator [unclassified Modestobacter]|uniref:AfsR/SARP family transcriptional regulator n=1 Tax=unclassified Modestobacter TaxID=2643866 RepID=UPI0022AA1D70|nr:MULTISPECIES: BTAD domain-containing putative transcriptional regulator [unclassified Modestobacter]MCZ2826540.1 BTAD domain-containing putative transcriptional regulator [Modestobacter sp. VKM Ac-2981]MCZ2852395.1 BTAD domain-containing putative transcriptional regulator [Modestobacter sp. VKM Ac-2982]